MSGSPIVIRPATAEDIAALAVRLGAPEGGVPTASAWVGEKDGVIVGIGGIAFRRGNWFAFIDVADEARPHKMTIMRSAIRFLEAMRSAGIRYIHAEVSPAEPGAQAWLESLGFELDHRSQHWWRWSAARPRTPPSSVRTR
jgi:hypothetical protein